jgi:adenine-specific DNA-methyltransferase
MFKKGIEKIISVGRTDYPKFLYTMDEFYGSRALFFIQTNRINLKFLTGILNSKIVHFWLYHKGKKQGEQLQVDKEPLLQIPIVKTDNKQTENTIIKCVEEIIDLHKQLQTVSLPNQKEQLENRIKFLENKIDGVVFGLYKLTECDMKIIKGSYNEVN